MPALFANAVRGTSKTKSTPARAARRRSPRERVFSIARDYKRERSERLLRLSRAFGGRGARRRAGADDQHACILHDDRRLVVGRRILRDDRVVVAGEDPEVSAPLREGKGGALVDGGRSIGDLRS